jgi:hypothetical protein
MKTALLLAAIGSLCLYQDVPTATFIEPFVGFQFNYPRTWTIVKSNKRKDRDRTSFSIPVEGSSSKAELDVDRTDYHASIDLWQTIQLRANEQLHRQVVRQWTQEVLGVSMLFSRIDYTDHDVAMSAVAGLYYTKTSQKMFLRLTSRTADFDKVFYEFGRVLETLRQLDGKLPEEDDPTKDLAPAPRKPELADLGPHAIETAKAHKTKETKAPVAVDIVVSTRKVTMHIPEGWAASNVKGNTADLSETSLSHSLHVEGFSLLDSDPAPAALVKLAAMHLDSFSKVYSREDSGPTTNKAGASIAAVWRIGDSAKGPLQTCEAMCALGDYYFLVTYTQTDKVQFKADRKLIELLLKQASVELAP